MSDALKQLCELLDAAGARLDFDLGRDIDIKKACTFCGDASAPSRKLYIIGRYPNGRTLSRPVCMGCEAVGQALEEQYRERGDEPAELRARLAEARALLEFIVEFGGENAPVKAAANLLAKWEGK